MTFLPLRHTRQAAQWLLMICVVLLGTDATPASPGLIRLGGGPTGDTVTAEAVFSAPRIAAGGPAVVAVTLTVAPTFHINPDAARSGPEWFPGQYPTTLSVVDPPSGVRVGRVQYAQPHAYEVEYAEQAIQVYDGVVTLYVPLLIGEDVEPGPLSLDLELEYQACDATRCLIPSTLNLTANTEVVAPGVGPGAADLEIAQRFAGFDPAGWSKLADASGVATPPEATTAPTPDPTAPGTATLWGTLLTALAAGFLLNFTPCVLPVVPLKVMNLAHHAGSRRRTVLLSLVMAAGVVGFWMAIAAALVGLKQFGAVNQLFQYPAFTLSVGVVIAVLAVSMLGLFTINLPRAVYQLNPTGDSVAGSLGFGVMTAVLATPCAGPLMGGAAFWATQQGTGTTLGVFAALGGGMALPYLGLAFFPGLMKKLPRAGAGSELLKQTMGLLMLAAAAFFVGTGIVGLTSDGSAAPSGAYWWVVGALIVAAGGWLFVRGAMKLATTPGGRTLAGVPAVLLIAAGAWVGVNLSHTEAATAANGSPESEVAAYTGGWMYYTPQRLAAAQAAGRAVVIDFTADWCLNCKALEKTVLETDAVQKAFAHPDLITMKVDITSARNIDGNALLKQMGRITIPLLVVLDAEGDEVFKADFYTPSEVVNAVKRAVGATAVPAARSEEKPAMNPANTTG